MKPLGWFVLVSGFAAAGYVAFVLWILFIVSGTS